MTEEKERNVFITNGKPLGIVGGTDRHHRQEGDVGHQISTQERSDNHRRNDELITSLGPIGNLSP